VVTLDANAVQAIHVQTEMVTNRPLIRTLRVAGVIDDDDTSIGAFRLTRKAH
jgi:hypothetical protein